MITLKNAQSIGCIDYGNNNFFEIMKDSDGTIGFMSHGEPADDNGDGTWSCEADSITKFLADIKDRPDFDEITTNLMEIFNYNEHYETRTAIVSARADYKI